MVRGRVPAAPKSRKKCQRASISDKGTRFSGAPGQTPGPHPDKDTALYSEQIGPEGTATSDVKMPSRSHQGPRDTALKLQQDTHIS